MNIRVQTAYIYGCSCEHLQFDSSVNQAISFLGIKDLIAHSMAIVLPGTECLQRRHYLPVNCFYGEVYNIYNTCILKIICLILP